MSLKTDSEHKVPKPSDVPETRKKIIEILVENPETSYRKVVEQIGNGCTKSKVIGIINRLGGLEQFLTDHGGPKVTQQIIVRAVNAHRHTGYRKVFPKKTAPPTSLVSQNTSGVEPVPRREYPFSLEEGERIVQHVPNVSCMWVEGDGPFIECSKPRIRYQRRMQPFCLEHLRLGLTETAVSKIVAEIQREFAKTKK